MEESAREVYGSVRVGGRNPKSVCWSNQVKAAVMRSKVSWKEVLRARNGEAKERCLEVYKEEKRKVYISKRVRGL